MKILYQTKHGVTGDIIHGYFSRIGIKSDQYSLIDIDQESLPILDKDYYIASGYECYKYLSRLTYMGFRTEPTWSQIKDLKLIVLHTGAVIVIADGSADDLIAKLDDCMNGRLPKIGSSLANNIVMTDPIVMINTMDWIINNIPVDEIGGIDYETTGLYDTSEKDNATFRATGVSISYRDYGWFFDFRFLGNHEKEFKDKYRELVRKFQFNLYAFNALFEIQTTLFEVDEYCEFCELRHCWIQDGRQDEWPTFKYMARYYLHVPDWDSEFETLSTVFGKFYKLVDNHEGSWEKFLEYIKDMTPGSMMTAEDLGLTEDELVIDKIDESKVIKDVQLILSQFTKEDLIEFNYLCNNPDWNVSSFGIIPSRLLGHYCNLDAFYTKECVNTNKGKYSELCDDVYRMNQKYGNLLHVTGIIKDTKEYDLQWKITNQILTHVGIGLTLHIFRRKLSTITSGKCLSSKVKLGYPTYTTIAPIDIMDKSADPKSWPTDPRKYGIYRFDELSRLAGNDKFYELWSYISDWTNPYMIAKGILIRTKEYLDSGREFNLGNKKIPRWMNAEYEYWGCIASIEKVIISDGKSTNIIGDTISENFDHLSDSDRDLILTLGDNIHKMAMNYQFNRLKNSCGEFYEGSHEESPARYYDHSGKPSDPIYVSKLNIPEDSPGFIDDMLSRGWSVDSVYYYLKDLIGERLYNTLYERNIDTNIMQELFGNYDIEKAKTISGLTDYQYSSLIDEINDWLFWKEDALSDSSYRKVSVIRGLHKVLKRVIFEYLGEVDAESFAMTSDYYYTKSVIDDLLSIPELKGVTHPDQIPDEITYQGKKWSLYDFQDHIIRSVITITSVASYNDFVENLMRDYMDKHKFGIFIGQYGDIYDRYMKKTDVSGMNWIDKFNTEFNEMDYSKLFVISEKDLTHRNDLSRVKLLLVNEFKNKVLRMNTDLARLKSDASITESDKIKKIDEDLKSLVPDFDKFRFLGIDAIDDLQVCKYDAEMTSGALEVNLKLYEDHDPDVNYQMIESGWQDTLNHAFTMVRNVVGWDSLTPEYQQDFLLPYGSAISTIASEVVNMYQLHTGIKAKDYEELLQLCEDNLTDVDKSWVINEDIYITDWLVSHLYTVSYLSDRYGDEFTDELVKYFNNMDFDMDHPLYPYKMMFMQRAFKKYNKILTYLTGTLSAYDCKYSKYDFNRFIGTRWAKSGEEVKVTVMRPEWYVNKLQSKRWGAAFHTVPSRSECKGIAGSTEDTLMSYMDISACEPRSIAKMSGDDKMQWYFDNDIDMYIECAEIFLGHKLLDKHQRKYYRSIFKTILLLILYNGGAATTASQTGLTVANAKKGIEVIKSKFPKLIEYIDSKVQYCLDNDGKIDSVLGDIICGTKGDPVKQSSQGINQVIQNYASVILVYGYAHLMHEAIARGYRIRSISMVHDSIQNLFDIHLLPKIQQFYTECYQSWLKDITGIFFKYDLEIGDNYFDLCSFRCQENGFVLEGTNRAINKILNKLTANDMPYEIIEKDSDLTEIYWDRYKDCLLSEGEARYHIDHSRNRVVFRLL